MSRHLVDRREVALGMKNGLEIPVPNICSFFGINRSTLFRWQAEAAAVPQEKEPRRAPTSSKVTPERAAWLAKEALERVTVTQARLAKDFETRFGVPVTQQHVSTVLRRQGIVRKKVRYVSSEAAAQPERHIAFHEQILASEPAAGRQRSGIVT
ncbi:hypothetical protein DFJ74DRAFT_701963 [Hyaloraphidium curvatum]|nr:hypothetical protein DFJ74DRAFT_701963 [Hyaloraphidium curvatum]